MTPTTAQYHFDPFGAAMGTIEVINAVSDADAIAQAKALLVDQFDEPTEVSMGAFLDNGRGERVATIMLKIEKGSPIAYEAWM